MIYWGQYDLGSYGGDEPGFLPQGMTSSGDVYAVVEQYRKFKGYAVLDRSKKAWRKVSGYPKGRLIGNDGDRLVFSEHVGGWTVLHQVEAGSLAVKTVQGTGVTDIAQPE